ncbi:hypothetical protein D4R75_11140 [bacterium]|nr:MAG: hypothetical protein D4R75_11140 [bacterium]
MANQSEVHSLFPSLSSAPSEEGFVQDSPTVCKLRYFSYEVKSSLRHLAAALCGVKQSSCHHAEVSRSRILTTRWRSFSTRGLKSRADQIRISDLPFQALLFTSSCAVKTRSLL